MKPKSTLRSSLLLASSSLLAISTASAADFWWDGVGGSWGDLTKWSSDATGTTDPGLLTTNADTATFNITGNNAANNVTLDATRFVKNLVFNSTGATNFRGNSSGTTARTLSFGGGSSITLASGAGAVTIGDDPATYGAVNIVMGSGTWTVTNSSLTVNGNVNIGGGALSIGTGDANGTITINGKISGTGTGNVISLATRNRVVLANDGNDFAGTLLISGGGSSTLGTLAVTSIADNGTACALGKGTTAITLGNGTASPGRLEYIGTASGSSNRMFTLGGTGNATAGIDNNGSGVITFTAADFNNAGSGTRTLVLGGTNTGTNTIQGNIRNDAGTVSLTKKDAGTWRLSGTSSYSGVTTVSGTGALEFSVAADGGSNSSLGSSSNAAANLLLGNTSTLRYVGAGGTTDRSFTINGTGNGNRATLDASGGGAIHFTNTASPAYGTADQSRQLWLDGTNTGNNTLAANIANNGSGAVQVQKYGTGKWVLTGTNTYSGPTAINNGTLIINGSTSSTSVVTVNSGGALGGSGTVGGATTIYGTHSPGNSPGIQTFGSNLTYNGGSSVVNWELVGNTTTNAANPNAIFDQIIVGGNLNFADATTINLSFIAAGSTVLWSDTFWDTDQSWTLYDVAGTTTNLSNLSLSTINWLDSGSNLFNTLRSGNSFTLSQSGNDVMLNYIVVPEPRAALLGGLGLLMLLRRRRA